MPKTHHLLIVSLALLPLTVMAETYKCLAPDGKVTYSGQMSMTAGVKCELMFVRKPPAGQEPAMADPVPETAAAPVDKSAKPAELTAADKELEAKRKKSETESAKKAAEDKQAEQKMKQENCESARANLRTYELGGRITKIDDKGEKAYLDDAEVKQKTEQARKDVGEFCGT